MIEHAGLALAGIAIFFLGLLKLTSNQPDERTARTVLAIFSAVAVIALFANAFDAGTGRILAFYAGFPCGYFIYRQFPRLFARPASSSGT